MRLVIVLDIAIHRFALLARLLRSSLRCGSLLTADGVLEAAISLWPMHLLLIVQVALAIEPLPTLEHELLFVLLLLTLARRSLLVQRPWLAATSGANNLL